jgi:hypothetical protein
MQMGNRPSSPTDSQKIHPYDTEEESIVWGSEDEHPSETTVVVPSSIPSPRRPMGNRPSSSTDSEKTISYDTEGEYSETVIYVPCKMCRGLHAIPTRYYPNPTIEKRKVSHYIKIYELFFPELV